MSLQAAAQHLAAQGRGSDSTLVHMSPREVKSLQELAMAHGGSLSVNPSTGLPEAGFLDNLLPMIIGAGVTAATGGAAAPWMVGLGVGGFELGDMPLALSTRHTALDDAVNGAANVRAERDALL